jgi:hypothetical protein
VDISTVGSASRIFKTDLEDRINRNMDIGLINTGWWFGTCFMIFPILGIIIPTDELIFFTNQ